MAAFARIASFGLIVYALANVSVIAPRAQPMPEATEVNATPLNATPLDPSLNEEIVNVPIIVAYRGGSHQREFVLSVFRPDGPGPFPVVVFSHGRNPKARPIFGRSRPLARYFVDRGFAVLAPTRVGYGVSGFDIDPERSSGAKCETLQYAPLAANVAAHIKATLTYARQQPWADSQRIVLAGQSAGGFGSIIAAGENLTGVQAVMNFAGGIGGNPQRPDLPCSPDDVQARMSAAAVSNPLPTLWIYAENDHLWGPRVPRDWHADYVRAGGRAELTVLPETGDNGHYFLSKAPKLWRPLVDDFLTRLGFAARQPEPHDRTAGEPAKAPAIEVHPLVNE